MKHVGDQMACGDKIDFELVDKKLSEYKVSVIDFINVEGRYISAKMIGYNGNRDDFSKIVSILREARILGGCIGDFGGRWMYDEHSLIIGRYH